MRDACSEVQAARSGMSYRHHLEVLFETGSLAKEVVYRDLSAQLDLLGRKLNIFIDSVERLHRTTRSDIPSPASRIAHLAS